MRDVDREWWDFVEWWNSEHEDDQLGKPPTHMEVCPTCRGRGAHVNRAIDGNGISTYDECWQDDDFREGYFSDRYDVTCERCGGRNVVEVFDEEDLRREVRAEWEQWQREMWESESISRQERMMGA